MSAIETAKSWQLELTETYRVRIDSNTPITREQAIAQVVEWGGDSPVRHCITAKPIKAEKGN